MFGKHTPNATNELNGGVQHKFSFANGYGASVVRLGVGRARRQWASDLRHPAHCRRARLPERADVADALDKIEALPKAGESA